jgi:pyruvate/2-oxoglutarate dehydrogenase complex dihydrolipoamide acyltransferase (E2) component
MRRAIGQRMMGSLQSTAQMTGFGKIDMGEAVAWREQLVASEKQLGVRITYTDLVLKACGCVLKELPDLNAYIDGDEVVSLADIHIGFAVSVEGGLLVPVIHHVDRLTLVEVAQRRIALIEKARTGTLLREEITGGSFTVSNFGSYGGDFETPILNAPQSALLGIGRIADEPAVRDKQVVVRPMMWMSLTFDHRLIDGAQAGRFRTRLRELLEQPTRLLAHLR